MSKESRAIAERLIEVRLPVPLDQANVVRNIVGSKWEFFAGTLNLVPQKIFERRVSFFAKEQRNNFVTQFDSGSINPIFAALFNDVNMVTCVTAYTTFDGVINVTQKPETIGVPTITTADVGTMMLANDLLLSLGASPHRRESGSEIVAALLDVCMAGREQN